MMEAIHEAMGARTEVFASPLNVHKNTKTYYSQFPRDSVFGVVGSAWEARWEQLGAYCQFNLEYTVEDLYRALKKAINATKIAEPVLWVGIYPTYAKSPYKKLLNKHMGYRWEQGENEETDPQLENQWDNNGKGYPEPERRFNRKDMVYKDGRDTWHEEMEAQQMQEDEIEFQQMEQEDEAAQMVAQHTQTLQQEEGGPEPQPIGGRIGEDGDEPTREDQWEVEEVELRRMKEEEITLMHEGQQEHREPQNQQETDHARQDTRMPSQGTEEPQDGQQGIALQVTQEMELPETQDMSMEAQQDEEDDLIEMAQQQEEA
eukprot:gene5142-biopygen5115